MHNFEDEITRRLSVTSHDTAIILILVLLIYFVIFSCVSYNCTVSIAVSYLEASASWHKQSFSSYLIGTIILII